MINQNSQTPTIDDSKRQENVEHLDKINDQKMNYHVFEPKENTFYLYFEEKNKPNIDLSNKIYRTIFGINFFPDFQRFHYLPRTTKIYTFIGFSTQTNLKQAQKIISLRCSIHNQKILVWNT